MKKHFLVFAIAATCACGANAQSTFRDVPNNHWAAQAVKRLAEAGIIVGRPANESEVLADETNAALAAPRVKAFLMANF